MIFLNIFGFHSYCHAWILIGLSQLVNTLRPRQNGRYSADDILKRIFVKENVWISIKISLKLFLSAQLKNFSIGSDYGLVPSRHQAIVWPNAGLISF